MAFTLGQHKAVQQSSINYSLAYGSSVTAGNLLIVVEAYYLSLASISTPITNTGTAGVQVWNPCLASPFSSSTDGTVIQMWWAIASGTGTCPVTTTWSGTWSGGEMYVSEWSGTSISGSLAQDGLGKSQDGTLSTTNQHVTLPSITTTYPDDLIVGYVSTANTVTLQTPWAQIDTLSGDFAFYRADLAAGTYPDANGYALPTSGATVGTYACVVAALGIPGAAIVGVPMPWFNFQ